MNHRDVGCKIMAPILVFVAPMANAQNYGTFTNTIFSSFSSFIFECNEWFVKHSYHDTPDFQLPSIRYQFGGKQMTMRCKRRKKCVMMMITFNKRLLDSLRSFLHCVTHRE